jgi:hypothetical protein
MGKLQITIDALPAVQAKLPIKQVMVDPLSAEALLT